MPGQAEGEVEPEDQEAKDAGPCHLEVKHEEILEEPPADAIPEDCGMNMQGHKCMHVDLGNCYPICFDNF